MVERVVRDRDPSTETVAAGKSTDRRRGRRSFIVCDYRQFIDGSSVFESNKLALVVGLWLGLWVERGGWMYKTSPLLAMGLNFEKERRERHSALAGSRNTFVINNTSDLDTFLV
jgi:hypothetical protein